MAARLSLVQEQMFFLREIITPATATCMYSRGSRGRQKRTLIILNPSSSRITRESSNVSSSPLDLEKFLLPFCSSYTYYSEMDQHDYYLILQPISGRAFFLVGFVVI